MDISDFCEKYDMLPRGCRVLAAVSGGKDSMCLLELLLSMQKERGLSVFCAHFDHRLRGEESAGDRRFVEEYCKKRGVPFRAGSADVAAYAAENGLGVEEAARLLRYEFLEKTAEEVGADRIATAHTADDNTETLLLNFSRGAGLRGLCGIPPVRGKIVRPLLTTSSSEIMEYLSENGIPHVEDRTNAEDFCARNRIRHGVIPLMREENGRFDENAARCMALLREDEECLERMAQRFVSDNFDGRSLPAAAFSELDRPVSARVLRLVAGSGLSAAHVEAVRNAAKSPDPHAAADVPGMRVAREYGRLFFGALEEGTVSPRTVSPGDSFELPGAGLRVRCEFIPDCRDVYNSVNNFYFKSDSICDTIIIKSRSEGDNIRLAGRDCTKSLKKLFSEAKLNGKARGLVPVFCDGAGVVAVYGFGIAERCVPQPGDDVLRIQIEKIQGENRYD